MTKLTTVHDALNNSIFSENSPGFPTSVRLEDELKDSVALICFKHGTTISAFLRECAVALKSDYENPIPDGVDFTAE